MPSTLTYPGVYIEEISSGVRTIAGVATSITAFVGWAPQGPTDRAVRIQSFADFQRVYGAIHPHSYLGYGVKQFFDNQGSDAYVLRLANPGDSVGECNAGGIEVKAGSVGSWSQFYGVSIKTRAAGPNIVRFTLAVVAFERNPDGSVNQDPNRAIVVDSFSNLSANPNDPRFADEIINDEKRGSLFVTIKCNGDPSDAVAVPLSAGTETPPQDPDEINSGVQLAQVKSLAQENSVLDKIDLFNLVCVPGLVDTTALDLLSVFCRYRRAMLIADCERDANITQLQSGPPAVSQKRNASFYFPWLKAADDLAEGRLTDFPPCGFMAGLYARTDATRGIWKAPAGTEATLTGALAPKVPMTDKENGSVNVKAVNCIRNFPVYGTVAWGARTMDGDDEVGSEWKYIPVRRTALYIEESLFRGTKWAVFEPNDEPLWAQLRLNVGAFMHDLFRQGAFQGRTPREAYFVKCDKETTPQNDINRGIVNIVVGFAPLKPAEFVVITLQQIAGQIET